MMDPIVYGWIGRGRVAITGAITIDGTYRGLTVDVTSGTFSIAFLAAATLGSGYHVAIYNSGSGVVTLNPNASEPIRFPDGSAVTKTLAQGQGCVLACTGTGWEAIAGAGLNTATTVTGSGTLNRLAMFTATGSTIGDSTIANGSITGVLTFAKTGTTARTATFQDLAQTVAALEASQTFTAVQAIDTGTANGVLDAAPFTSQLRLASADGASAGLNVISYGATPRLTFQYSNGTRAAKTVPVSGNAPCQVYTQCWDGSAFFNGASFRMRTGATWGPNEAGCDWRFSATLIGDTTRTLVESTVISATGVAVAAPGGQISVVNQTVTGTDVSLLGLVTTSGGNLQFRVDDLSLANPIWKLNCNANESLSFTVNLTQVALVNNTSFTTSLARILGNRSITSAASTTVLTTTDHVLFLTGSTTHTFTLPAAAAGRELRIKNRSTGTLTINRAGSDTIDGGTTISVTTGNWCILIANGTDWCVFS